MPNSSRPSSAAPSGESSSSTTENPTKAAHAARRTSPDPGSPKSNRLPPKRRGELAEGAFLLKASSLGFSVAKPWGDSDRYDFILDSGARSWRIQVKTASSVGGGGYSIHACGSVPSRIYTAEEIDFIVAYLASQDLWYVLPVRLFTKVRHVKLFPFRSASRFERYREAWCLMACPIDGRCKKEVDVRHLCQQQHAQNFACPNAL